MKTTTRIAWLSRDDDGWCAEWTKEPEMDGDCWCHGSLFDRGLYTSKGHKGPFYGCRPGQCIKIRITESVVRLK